MFLVLLRACPFCILPVYFWAALLFFVINTCYFIHKKMSFKRKESSYLFFTKKNLS